MKQVMLFAEGSPSITNNHFKIEIAAVNRKQWFYCF